MQLSSPERARRAPTFRQSSRLPLWREFQRSAKCAARATGGRHEQPAKCSALREVLKSKILWRASTLIGCHIVFLWCCLAFADPVEHSVYLIGVNLVKNGERCALLVNSVSPHSPAEAAGIKGGDEVLRIDGKETKSLTSLQA